MSIASKPFGLQSGRIRLCGISPNPAVYPPGQTGFIAAIRNERVKDKKEMPPAEPDAWLEEEGEMVKKTK